jgi:multidrug efflux pump subunit AcrA (membrane-fusion protein)
MRLDGMIDPATRTRTAHLALEAPAPEAEPGAYARARFETPAGGVPGAASATGVTTMDAAPPVSVPRGSLIRRGALTGVYVIRDGRASLRWIKLGRASGENVEVLAGLWPGEDIALDPGPLADGRPVEIRR